MASGSTARRGIPYPTGVDPAAFRADMQALATELDDAPIWNQGSAGSLPAVGTVLDGFMYGETSAAGAGSGAVGGKRIVWVKAGDGYVPLARNDDLVSQVATQAAHAAATDAHGYGPAHRYAFGVYKVASSAINRGDSIAMAESYDPGNVWSGGTWTAPRNGVFHFDGAVRVQGLPVNEYFYARLRRSTTTAVFRAGTTIISPVAGDDFTSQVSTDLAMVAGDTLCLDYMMKGTVTNTVLGVGTAHWTYLTGFMVTPT